MASRFLFAFLPLLLSAETPAEQKISQATSLVVASPKRASSHNALTQAYLKRARETSDTHFLELAEASLKESFSLEAENFEGLKLKSVLLLAQGQYAKALQLAKVLNKKNPDDISIYGTIVDADIALGNYDDAEKAAQWMLDLRPGNVAGLLRGAKLRELFGDIEGSLDFLKQAYSQVPPLETEERAWISTQTAGLLLQKEDLVGAEQLLQRIFKLYPDYQEALGVLGRLRLAQKKDDAAVEAFTNKYAHGHHTADIYDLAVAQERAGKKDEASRTFADFEAAALKQSDMPVNANRQLVFYYLEHSKHPERALPLARKEFAVRQDVFTLDALSWALFQSGQIAEARSYSARIAKVGIRDPELSAHAKQIASATGPTALPASIPAANAGNH